MNKQYATISDFNKIEYFTCDNLEDIFNIYVWFAYINKFGKRFIDSFSALRLLAGWPGSFLLVTMQCIDDKYAARTDTQFFSALEHLIHFIC